ncbi:MAG TPA: hypothetical protein VKB26_06150 [Candidatus Acidoferrales bacterium]|nr:hypothetical protein [Candidatus Acidoferrales bacterium]
MKLKLAFAAFLLLLSGAFAARSAYAQETTASPVTLKAKTEKIPKVKIDTFKGEVVRMNTVSIIVRDPKDSYIVRTFTFSPDLTKKLQSLIERGGYQPGDVVTVRYKDGTSEAELIKGKPSKGY